MSDLSNCMEEKAQVVAIEGPWAWVEAEAKSACAGCQSKSACPTGAMNSMFTKERKMRLKVKNDFEARMREWVVIGWTGGDFLKTVAKTYLLPSFLCVVFASVGGLHSEAASALGGLGGLVIGLSYTALGARKMDTEGKQEIIFLRRTKESDNV